MKHFLSHLSWFVVILFTLQILDVPPVSAAKNPKTCCGRQVCLCTHAKGERCSLTHGKKVFVKIAEKKSGISRKVSDPHASCHLKKPGENQNHKKTEELKKIKIKSGSPFFAHAPCSTNQNKSALPGMVKDYLIHRDLQSWEASLSPQSLHLMISHWKSVSASGIEHPPRHLSVSF